MEFFVEIQAIAAPLVEEIGTKYLLIFKLTCSLSDCTLKNKIPVNMLFSAMYKFSRYCTVNNYFNVPMCKPFQSSD